jgi:hypothetical protein
VLLRADLPARGWRIATGIIRDVILSMGGEGGIQIVRQRLQSRIAFVHSKSPKEDSKVSDHQCRKRGICCGEN